MALQAQEAPSPYLALWNRVEAFDADELDLAFASQDVVKAQLLRDHAPRRRRRRLPGVPRGDAGARCARHACTTGGSARRASRSTDTEALVPDLLAFAATPRRNDEVEAWLEARFGEPEAADLVGHPPVRAVRPRHDRRRVVVRPRRPTSGRTSRAGPATRPRPSGTWSAATSRRSGRRRPPTSRQFSTIYRAAGPGGRPRARRRAGDARRARRTAGRRPGRSPARRGHARAATAAADVGQRAARLQGPRRGSSRPTTGVT